jgi:glycosyltransferase involved in cell wall biosynthesis
VGTIESKCTEMAVGSIAPKDRETTKCTKGHEKREEVSTTDSTDEHGLQKRMATPGEPGLALSFQNPFASELARDSENTSPTRSAIGPANSEDLKLNSYKLKTPPPEAGAALDPRPSTLDAPGLVVGRLQNLKGAELLCQALRLVPEVEIEWAGGDTNWGQSGMKASEYLAGNYPDIFGKRLRWLGQLDRAEVGEKMQAASFLVTPSFLDVFNLTVAEGMEAGLPVICSRAAGAEMLIQDGISGFHFDPAMPEQLAECLKIVAGMSAAEKIKMGQMAQDSVKNLLDGEKIIRLLEESYDNVLKSAVPSRHDPWLGSLLSPMTEPGGIPKPNFVQRALRKAGQILADI